MSLSAGVILQLEQPNHFSITNAGSAFPVPVKTKVFVALTI